MTKNIKGIIHAAGDEIRLYTSINNEDYISLTDLAKHRNPDAPADIIKNWMRLRNTIEYLGLWEQLKNPEFKLVEFDQFKNEAGSNSFVLSPQKWITATHAIGMTSKSGRYDGGTFAHADIAFEFASWISPEFKLYVIQDYQRLKGDEQHRDAIEWNVRRLLAKANYRIHTDAIKENLIDSISSGRQQGFVYADEADLLNVALFNKTAKQWRLENPGKTGNIRDFASIDELLVMTNLENINAMLIAQGMPQMDRFQALRSMAISQLQKLVNTRSARRLNELSGQQTLE